MEDNDWLFGFDEFDRIIGYEKATKMHITSYPSV